MTRTLFVTLKSGSGSYGPKSIRFEGQSYAELRRRLADAHFPHFDDHAFVEVKGEDGQFVCLMDTDELPAGDIYVTVQSGPIGPGEFKWNAPEAQGRTGHRPPPAPPGHFHRGGGPGPTPPWMAFGHPVPSAEKAHHGHHHHHHHDHLERTGGSPHRDRHGHRHERHHSRDLGHHDDCDDPYLGSFGPLPRPPHPHGPPPHPHGPPPHEHGRHRHEHHGLHRAHSPHGADCNHKKACGEDGEKQKEHATDPAGDLSGGEGGRWHGRFARRGGCIKGGMHGMKGRGYSWCGPPHGIWMRGYGHHGGHHHHHRSERSPSPPGRRFFRSHPGSDFVPNFRHMSLNDDEIEAYAAASADPAEQLAIARSFQDNVVHREEDWQEVGPSTGGYHANEEMY